MKKIHPSKWKQEQADLLQRLKEEKGFACSKDLSVAVQLSRPLMRIFCSSASPVDCRDKLVKMYNYEVLVGERAFAKFRQNLRVAFGTKASVGVSKENKDSSAEPAVSQSSAPLMPPAPMAKVESRSDILPGGFVRANQPGKNEDEILMNRMAGKI